LKSVSDWAEIARALDLRREREGWGGAAFRENLFSKESGKTRRGGGEER